MQPSEAQAILRRAWGSAQTLTLSDANAIKPHQRNEETPLACLERLAEMKPCPFGPFSVEAKTWFSRAGEAHTLAAKMPYGDENALQHERI